MSSPEEDGHPPRDEHEEEPDQEDAKDDDGAVVEPDGPGPLSGFNGDAMNLMNTHPMFGGGMMPGAFLPPPQGSAGGPQPFMIPPTSSGGTNGSAHQMPVPSSQAGTHPQLPMPGGMMPPFGQYDMPLDMQQMQSLLAMSCGMQPMFGFDPSMEMMGGPGTQPASASTAGAASATSSAGGHEKKSATTPSGVSDSDLAAGQDGTAPEAEDGKAATAAAATATAATVPVAEAPPVSAAQRKKRRKKDPNAPRRPLSAYNLFFREVRKILKDSNDSKGLSFEDMVRSVSKRWREADEETKSKFQAMAKEDNERYYREMKEYHERSDVQNAMQKQNRKRRKILGVPKRPLSGYNIFFSEEHGRIKEEMSSGGKQYQNVTVEIARRWAELGPEKKAELQRRAEADRQAQVVENDTEAGIDPVPNFGGDVFGMPPNMNPAALMSQAYMLGLPRGPHFFMDPMTGMPLRGDLQGMAPPQSMQAMAHLAASGGAPGQFRLPMQGQSMPGPIPQQASTPNHSMQGMAPSMMGAAQQYAGDFPGMGKYGEMKNFPMERGMFEPQNHNHQMGQAMRQGQAEPGSRRMGQGFNPQAMYGMPSPMWHMQGAPLMTSQFMMRDIDDDKALQVREQDRPTEQPSSPGPDEGPASSLQPLVNL